MPYRAAPELGNNAAVHMEPRGNVGRVDPSEVVDAGPFNEWLEKWRESQHRMRYAPSHRAGGGAVKRPRQFSSGWFTDSENSRRVATIEDLARLAGINERVFSYARTRGTVSIDIVDRVLVAAGGDVLLSHLYPDH